MNSICGSDCCGQCSQKGASCRGCRETEGHPRGGECFAARMIEEAGTEAFESLKREIISEVNALGLPGLTISQLYLLNGAYINLEYTAANGQKFRLLRDDRIYLGAQAERPGSERCYGVAADTECLVISEYGCEGADPELVLYRQRK